MGTLAVRITNADKSYGRTPNRRTVLKGLDLSVYDREFLIVLGPSGGGKSTLLRLLAGLEHLDSGTIEWFGNSDGRPPIGMVFQQPLLMPWLTVRGNVRFGDRYRANQARFDDAWPEKLLSRFALDGVADSYPDQLSGGQAQRVAVARAAAIRPRLLLLDEPFSALDPRTRRDLQEWLRDTTTELGLTTILVTHDVDEAVLLGDRVVLLDGSGSVHRIWDNDPGASDTTALREELLAHYRFDEPAESVVGGV